MSVLKVKMSVIFTFNSLEPLIDKSWTTFGEKSQVSPTEIIVPERIHYHGYGNTLPAQDLPIHENVKCTWPTHLIYPDRKTLQLKYAITSTRSAGVFRADLIEGGKRLSTAQLTFSNPYHSKIIVPEYVHLYPDKMVQYLVFPSFAAEIEGSFEGEWETKVLASNPFLPVSVPALSLLEAILSNQEGSWTNFYSDSYNKFSKWGRHQEIILNYQTK
jgi:hypothetical protein